VHLGLAQSYNIGLQDKIFTRLYTII